MTRHIKQSLAALALAALALPLAVPAHAADKAPAAQSKPHEVVKETIGAWEIRCASNDSSRCVMAQTGKTKDGKVALEMTVWRPKGLKTKDGKDIPAVIQIVTPLGTILRTGVKVQVDSGKPRSGGFEVCLPSGCVVRDPVSDTFLKSFKAGANAELSFNLLQQGEIKADISLNGFTKAFNSL